MASKKLHTERTLSKNINPITTWQFRNDHHDPLDHVGNLRDSFDRPENFDLLGSSDRGFGRPDNCGRLGNFARRENFAHLGKIFRHPCTFYRVAFNNIKKDSAMSFSFTTYFFCKNYWKFIRPSTFNIIIIKPTKFCDIWSFHFVLSVQ